MCQIHSGFEAVWVREEVHSVCASNSDEEKSGEAPRKAEADASVYDIKVKEIADEIEPAPS